MRNKRTRNLKNRILSMLLAVTMIATMLPQNVMMVSAAELPAETTVDDTADTDVTPVVGDVTEEQEESGQDAIVSDQVNESEETVVEEEQDTASDEQIPADTVDKATEEEQEELANDEAKVYEPVTMEIGKGYNVSLKNSDKAYYNFTASAGGYYQFVSKKTGETGSAGYEIKDKNNERLSGDSLFTKDQEKIYNVYLDKDDTISVCITGNSTEAVDVAASMKKVPVVNATYADDKYTVAAEMADITLTPVISNYSAYYTFKVAMKDGKDTVGYRLKYQYVKSGEKKSVSNHSEAYFSTYEQKLNAQNLDAETDYELCAYIADSKQNMLYAIEFEGKPIQFKTTAAEDIFVLGEKGCVAKSFSVDVYYTKILKNVHAQMKKKTDSWDEQEAITDKQMYATNYAGSTSFTGLIPSTEYDIRVIDTNENNKVIYETSVTTKAFEGTPSVTYTSTDKGSFKFNYTFTYAGEGIDLPYSAVYYDVLDESGNSILTGSYSTQYLNVTDTKAYVNNVEVKGCEGGKEYTLKTWLADSNQKNKYFESSEKITVSANPALTEHDIIVTLSEDSDTQRLRVEVTSESYTPSVYAVICSNDLNDDVIRTGAQSFPYDNKRATYGVATVMPGVTYTYKVIVDGVAKTVTHKYRDAIFAPTLTVSPGCFDAVITAELNPTDASETGEYFYNIGLYTQDEDGTKVNVNNIGSTRLANDNGYKNSVYAYSSLEPGTTYYVKFEITQNYKLVYSTFSQTFTTKAFTAKSGTISVNAKEGGYEAAAEIPVQSEATAELTKNASKYLYWYIKQNADGQEYKYKTSCSTEMKDGKLYSKKNVTFSDLMANTEYSVKVMFNNQDKGTVLAETTFRTPADTRTIVPSEPELMYGGVRFEAKVTGSDETESVYVYYRQKGAESWQSTGLSAKTDENDAILYYDTKVNTKSYKAGDVLEYAFGLKYEGYKTLKASDIKEVTIPADNRKIKLTLSKEYATGVEFTMLIEGLKSYNGYVEMYHRVKGSSDAWEYLSKSISNDKENIIQIDTQNYAGGTDVEYIIGFVDSTQANPNNLTGKVTGEFKVPVDDRKLVLTKTTEYIDYVCMEGKVEGKENGKSKILLYYRPKDSAEEWNKTSTTPSKTDETNEYTWKFELSSSRIDVTKTYEYCIGFGESSSTKKEDLKNTTEGIFACKADDRSVSVTKTTPELYSVTIAGELTGTARKRYNNEIQIFYHEKGSSAEWNRGHTYVYNEGDSNWSFEIHYFNSQQLKENTTYEYKIVVSEESSLTVDQLVNPVVGEVTTKKDTRTVKDVQVTAGYKKATAVISVSGLMEEISSNYVYGYYHKKGETTWESTSGGYINKLDAGDGKATVSIGGLDINTTYEYVFALQSASKPEDIKAGLKKSGEFTTRAASGNYAVDLSVNTFKSTYNTEALNVTLKGTPSDSEIVVLLGLDSGATVSVNLSDKKSYKGTAVFTGLKGATKYNVISAAFSVKEDSTVIPLNTQTMSYEFTTVAAKNPSSLKLSKSVLNLNATGTGEGTKYDFVRAIIMPDEVARDVKWTTSDKAVATVSSSGKVTAVGAGTATITATSVYNSELTATCEVRVKGLAVGMVMDGALTDVSGMEFQIIKGKSAVGLSLYEKIPDGSMVPVNEYTVSFAKNNLIAWNAALKALDGLNVGNTDCYFEKDGVKAQVNVTILAEGKNFGIKELVLPDGDEKKFGAYKAIPVSGKKDEYDIALVPGVSYVARGMISPMEYFDSTEFAWTSADESIVKVNNGVITPVAAGTAKVTVKAIRDAAAYKDAEVTLTINVKALPTTEVPTVYAATNVAQYLKDIDLEKALNQKGWSWDTPETPLYSLPVNHEAYKFDATYSGTEFYGYHSEVKVYLSTINSVIISDPDIAPSEAGKKVSVVTANGVETVTLNMEPSYFGNINKLDYTIEVKEVAGLIVKKSGKQFKVSSGIPETYPVTANVKIGEKVVATGTYTIKAVASSPIAKMVLSSDNEAVQKQLNADLIKCDVKLDDFVLNVKTFDRAGMELGTRLFWTTSDKTVAQVIDDKSNSHKATIVVKGSGHAVIGIKADDDAGYLMKLNFEFRDHKPRMEAKKVTVNTAYDYEKEEGRRIAAGMVGTFELAGVYGDEIQSVKLLKADGKTESEFDVIRYSSADGADLFYYMVKPKKENPDVAVGAYKYKLAVKTTASEDPYLYDLTVNVINKKPIAKANNDVLNLFYIPDTATLSISLDIVNAPSMTMVWEDNNPDVGNEFVMGSYLGGYYNAGKMLFTTTISQDRVKVTNGKPETGVDTGKLVMTIPGVREQVVINNYKIKTNYKKAALIARNTSTKKTVSNIMPVAAYNYAKIEFYDNTKKHTVSLNNGKGNSYYNDVMSNVSDLTISGSGNAQTITYVGSKASQKVTFMLTSDNWREDVTAVHTVKSIKPSVYLYSTSMVVNTLYMSDVYTNMGYKNYYESGVLPLDLEIIGVNDNAKAVMTDDRMTIYMSGTSFRVRLNDLAIMKASIPDGVYKYKLIPYIKDVDGNKMQLNTLNFQIKVISKPITVKTTAKGTLDLVNTSTSKYTNSILTTPKFENMGSTYSVTNVELLGDYQDYFKLVNPDGDTTTGVRYIKINNAGKLKAGQNYDLKMRYTVRTYDKEYTVVTSNVLKIKPKQSAPAVKCSNNNQTYFAATNGMYRTYTLKTPSSYYSIEGVTGSIDVNKDGIADAEVSNFSRGGEYGYVRIRISDKDALLAASNGKVHTIPLTVTLVGRDGISKDVKISVKIKVKR